MINDLKAEIAKRKDSHYIGQRLWSFVHHMTAFGAVILSLSAAAISQAKDWTPSGLERDTLIALVSLVAASLAALTAKGGFERKWIANRMTRSQLEILELDLLGDAVDPSAIKETLKRIIAEHDAGITSSKP